MTPQINHTEPSAGFHKRFPVARQQAKTLYEIATRRQAKYIVSRRKQQARLTISHSRQALFSIFLHRTGYGSIRELKGILIQKPPYLAGFQ